MAGDEVSPAGAVSAAAWLITRISTASWDRWDNSARYVVVRRCGSARDVYARFADLQKAERVRDALNDSRLDPQNVEFQLLPVAST